MTNEVAVPEPLSGTEIIDAVVFKIREAMRRDCFLSPNSAYEFFSGQFHIQIKAVDCGREADVNVKVDVTKGNAPEPGAPVQTATVKETIPKEAPNVVRRATRQSVPVVTTDNTGRNEQRRVTYEQKEDKLIPRGGSKANRVGAPGKRTSPAA